ncbi:helix-turn-helix domain-containing protein [Rhodococcus sp. WWJCD1]|uniref:helix-turn-helix domain-containing protein n=1 Tax=Rhodococcus sp. WWJCD1 TaxID=2022519 RepID=UPI00113FEB03|nr:helix-turn-helix domain-containing protein [Rhodococcus sp. WWJCD1]
MPAAFDDARAALRVTAATGESGATRIAADDLGALKLLAQNADSPTALREIQLIDRAAAACGWVEDTIIALATSDSRRAAGAVLGVHHSTLQQRIVLLGRLLDYSVQGADGRLRAYLAVMLRRARRNDW